ncbi:MAG: hypothetical protein ACRYF0_18915 [Janthinobacterium lividum]
MADVTGNFLYDDVLPRVEQIGWLLSITGLVSKYYLFAKADIMLIVGIGTLAVVYFLQAYAPISAALGSELEGNSSFSEQAARGIQPPFLGVVASKVIGIGGATTLLGVLSKLVFWKGATPVLLVGSLSLIIALVILASVGQFSRKGFIIATLGVILLFIPTETLIRTFYRDDPALVEKMIFQHQHPRDKAAQAEIARLLSARRNR